MKLILPQWVMRETKERLDAEAADRRVRALRESLLYDFSFGDARIGQTVTIRRPKRYRDE